jgi:hypothetical protein
MAIWYLYFVVVWYNRPVFGISHQEKSGNPGRQLNKAAPSAKINVSIFILLFQISEKVIFHLGLSNTALNSPVVIEGILVKSLLLVHQCDRTVFLREVT